MRTTRKTGATFDRHNSNSNRGTPRNFTKAVEDRFGPLVIDLAATEDDRVCFDYLGVGSEVGTNALLVNWRILQGNLWLNPPFDQLAKFAEKFGTECAERSAFAFFLAPSSTGSNWFQQYLVPYCYILELTDRLTFVGETQPYPKDLILAVAGYGLVGRAAWHWDLTKRKAYER